MTPMIFGPGSRRLFGVYHATEGAADAAVLLCPPFGQEAIRTHRMFRVLSDRLARAGMPVLRFDYHGTGDAPGEDFEGDIHGWVRDVGIAHEELRRRAAPRRIIWLGSRLGAAMAVLATQGGYSDLSRLVLWDPILDGARYLDDVRTAHVSALEVSYLRPRPEWRRSLVEDKDAFTDELLGFAVSPELRQQLRALSPSSMNLPPLHTTIVLADPEDTVAHTWTLEQAERGAPVRLVPFSHSLVWTSDPFADSALVPAEAVQCLWRQIHE